MDVAGAFATRLLALYGADVIAIEPPEGHPPVGSHPASTPAEPPRPNTTRNAACCSPISVEGSAASSSTSIATMTGSARST